MPVYSGDGAGKGKCGRSGVVTVTMTCTDDVGGAAALCVGGRVSSVRVTVEVEMTERGEVRC